MRAPMHTTAVNLTGEEYLGGLRANGALFIPALAEARVGETAAVRVGLAGLAVRATLFGSVSLVRRVGRPSLPAGAEILLDPLSLPAARFLAQAARGGGAGFRDRGQRLVVQCAITVVVATGAHPARTHNVSESGLSLAWPRTPLGVGSEVQLELRRALFAPRPRAVVCWSGDGPLGPSLGLRVQVAGRAGRAWRRFVEDAANATARVV